MNDNDAESAAAALGGSAPVDRGQRRIKSVEVGFRTIRALIAADGFLPLARIAAIADMPSSKAYIYLASFMREGLVQQDARTGHYGLGPLSVQIGLAAIRSLDVVSLSRDIVDDLRDLSECGVTLAVWSKRGPTVMLAADGDGQGALALRVGHVFWPTTSASGRVFLAHLPRRETDAAIRAEEAGRGKASERYSEDALRRIREDGFAASLRPAVTGRLAIAAPVFDFSGKVGAALAILADPASVDEPLAHVRDAAASISARLGYRSR